MRYFILLLSSVLFLSATSLTKQIDTSKKNIVKNSIKKKRATRKLDKIAINIKQLQKDIIVIERKLEHLEVNELKSEKKLKKLQTELVGVEESLGAMSKSLEDKGEEVTRLLVENFSTKFAMEQSHELTRDVIIKNTLYKIYQKNNKMSLLQLKSEIKKLEKEQKSKLYLRNKTKQNIVEINRKQQHFLQKKKEKETLYKNLSEDEENYSVKFQKIVDEQYAFRKTLGKLNILQEDQVRQAKKEALERKKAIRLAKLRKQKLRKANRLAKQKAKEAKIALKNAKTEIERQKAKKAFDQAEKEKKIAYSKSVKIKVWRSSYKKPKLFKYRGVKTISPISHPIISERFGSYIDPIYHVKNFRDGVIFKSKKKETKVHNVLNGRVVFAGFTIMKGNVVMIAHSHQLHTVYAHLSMIAPTIKVGKKVRKGYIIGKIRDNLFFQATKKSKYLNPLKLIKI